MIKIDSQLLWQITAIGGWLFLVLWLGNVIKQVYDRPELTRKFVHIGTGNVILLAWGLNCSLPLCLVFSILFTVIAYLSYSTNILPMLNGIGRDTRGVFYYALSITCLVALFWGQGKPEFATIGIMMMSWGDGLAALVGQRWGRHKYWIGNNQRSIEGSLTMFVVSSGVTTIILWLSNYPLAWLIAVPSALVATALEAVSVGGTDNLTVPLFGSLVAYWLVFGSF
jgi:phytol kinase